jgi:limonene-1,2-epoxide hydrolase
VKIEEGSVVSDVQRLVEEFMTALVAVWPQGDASRLARFFSEDAIYRNGPLDPVEGRAAIVESLGQFMAMGGEVDVEIVHMMSDDSTVMTERVDYWIGPRGRVPMRMMGILEIHDGMITSWRDYFDMNEFTAQLGDASN